uniref:Uncharacterized protein n=1 Tax=Cyprinodon variegatus TaxID=28743 RepID=A0A3Q2FWA7_CYPVA
MSPLNWINNVLFPISTTVLGQTPLHFAASEGLLESTEILVKAGADLLAKDKMGLTPLDMAHIWCHRKVARYPAKAITQLQTASSSNIYLHSMWHCEKMKEMEEIKLTHVLYRDLINKVEQDHLVKKVSKLLKISNKTAQTLCFIWTLFNRNMQCCEIPLSKC